MRKLVVLPFIFAMLLSQACSPRRSHVVDQKLPLCASQPLKSEFSQNQLTRAIGDNFVEALAFPHQPNEEGAIGRNRGGYVHVRFQAGISPLVDFAIDQQRPEVLELAILAIEYAFMHQNPMGDFALNLPDNAGQSETISEGEKASATVIFLAELGSSLLALKDSEWFNESEDTQIFRSYLESLQGDIAKSLAYLKSVKSLLAANDNYSSSQMLYDALAFYSLGKYFNDERSLQIGRDFLRKVIAGQDPSGYFIESGGYDSHYQGVSLLVGFKLLTLLGGDEKLRQNLWHALACGAEWQAERISAKGEISTEGNQRVYVGGETIWGVETSLSATNTLTAFLYMHVITGDETWLKLARRIVNYYSE